MKLKIGNVELANNVILAPMAGVTDLPFRVLCQEQGCGLVCMEMVSAKAILYKNKNTQELLQVDEHERPVSLQLFGSDPKILFISLPIKLIMGEFIAVVTSVPSPMLWKDAVANVFQVIVVISSNKVKVKTIEITSKIISKLHLVLFMLSLKCFANSATNNS